MVYALNKNYRDKEEKIPTVGIMNHTRRLGKCSRLQELSEIALNLGLHFSGSSSIGLTRGEVLDKKVLLPSGMRTLRA